MSLQNLIEEYSQVRQEFLNKAKTSFKDEIKEFFRACPEVKAIKWCQYTPFYNDGDPCVFRVMGAVFTNTEDTLNVSIYGEYEGEEEGVWVTESTWGIPEELDHIKPKLEEFDSLICSSEMESVLLDMFGDHSMITVTAKDISVDTYVHD